jgi:hypothetical protein
MDGIGDFFGSAVADYGIAVNPIPLKSCTGVECFAAAPVVRLASQVS